MSRKETQTSTGELLLSISVNKRNGRLNKGLSLSLHHRGITSLYCDLSQVTDLCSAPVSLAE